MTDKKDNKINQNNNCSLQEITQNEQIDKARPSGSSEIEELIEEVFSKVQGNLDPEELGFAMYTVEAEIKFGNLKMIQEKWEKERAGFSDYVRSYLWSLRSFPGVFSDIVIDSVECERDDKGTVTAIVILKFMVSSEEASLLSEDFVLNILERRLQNCSLPKNPFDELTEDDLDDAMEPTDFSLSVEEPGLPDTSFVKSLLEGQRARSGSVPGESCSREKEIDETMRPFTVWDLRRLMSLGCQCGQCDRKPFTPEDPLSLAPACCKGGLQALYCGDQTLRLCCFQCGKTYFRLKLATN